MVFRNQRTIQQAATVFGPGFLTGADVSLTFGPAAENTGIVFERIDLPDRPRIAALLENVVSSSRRTTIRRGDVSVDLIEHVMAALAGLQIDNCVVGLNASEPPGGDGSSLMFVQAILEAGIREQRSLKPRRVVHRQLRVQSPDGRSEIAVCPIPRQTWAATYELDYGPRCVIKPQVLTMEFSPEAFVTSLAFARTFVLEAEATALRAQGIGTRVTEKNLLVFGENGPVGNKLRTPDECVRHKILDCVGDFALLGCDLVGHFKAYRSGHALNHEICRAIEASTVMDFGDLARAA